MCFIAVDYFGVIHVVYELERPQKDQPPHPNPPKTKPSKCTLN